MNGQWGGTGALDSPEITRPSGDGLFATELRRLRLAQGTSQAALARAVHYSNSYLCKVEKGTKEPTADLAKRCDDALATGGILTALLATMTGSQRRASGRTRVLRAAQLPASTPDFTGRTWELATIGAAFTSAPAGAAAVVAITGPAGVGKTALAVRSGREIARRLGDGQLFLNMGGNGPATALRPAEALARFLRALGVPEEQLPSDPEEAAALYRSALAGRQMLIVLDNVASPAQVRPLLPADGGCNVIITSRDRLTGLAASHGISRLALDILPMEDAVALLARVLGSARVSAQADEAAELAAICSQLPLALRIAAAKLAEDEACPLADYVAALRAGDRLAALEAVGDEAAGVRAAFARSYTTLSAQAQRFFRLLGLAPGPDISMAAAAELAGLPASDTAGLLAVLEAAHLVSQHHPGRFAMHDLLGEYARSLALGDGGGGASAADAARQRLYLFYVRSAAAAAQLISPNSARLPVPSGPATSFASAAEAVSWLDAERANLIGTARQAAISGPPEVAWLLSDATGPYFWLRRHGPDWLALTEAGLLAAQASGDDLGQASAHWRLADAQFSTGQYDQAIAGYLSSAALAGRHGYARVQGAVLGNLGMLYREQGLLGNAVDCYRQSLDLAESIGLPASVAANLSNLGIVYMELGQLELAVDYDVRALAMHSEAGGPLRMARAMLNLAMAYHYVGRWEDAESLLLKALPMHRAAADPVGEAHARNSLAALYCDQGRYDESHALATEAIKTGRQLGDRTVEIDSLNQLGAVCLHRKQYHEALALYQQATTLAAQVGHYPHSEALIGLTGCCRALGRIADAARHVEAAVALTRELGFRALEGAALTAQARLLLDSGGQSAAAQAVELARTAVKIQQTTGHRLGRVHADAALTAALRESGRAAEAALALAQAGR